MGLMGCIYLSIKIFYLNSAKDYYFSLYQEIIDSTISFHNVILFQYEELIKYFGEQSYTFITSDLLREKKDPKNLENVVVQYSPQKVVEEDQDIPLSEYKIYLYSYNNIIYNMVRNLITMNAASYIYMFYSVKSFRIPYYGNISFINDYVFYTPQYQSLFSISSNGIKKIIDSSDGNIPEKMKTISNFNYIKYKSFFIVNTTLKIFLFDMLYTSKAFVFHNYLDLINEEADESTKVNYIKNQSKYFQSINYGNDEILLIDNADISKSKIVISNNIINDYIDFLFLYIIMKYDDIIDVPVYYENNTILSKDICYFFLIKQIKKLKNIIDTSKVFSEEVLNNIYNNLKKGESTIEDCLLDKYFSHNLINKLHPYVNPEFNKIYDLDNSRRITLFQLIKEDPNSYFFIIKHSYPNFYSIKQFAPKYFPSHQINIFSFVSGKYLVNLYNTSEQFFYKVKILSALTEMTLWAFIFIIIFYIMNKTRHEVIKPILDLQDILNSKEIIDENKMNYIYDDNINNFFTTCKSLLLLNNNNVTNSVMEYKLYMKEKLNTENEGEAGVLAPKNNMIMNIKMINELIEAQKIQEINNQIVECDWQKVSSLNKFYQASKHLNIIDSSKKNNHSNKFCLSTKSLDFGFINDEEEEEDDLINIGDDEDNPVFYKNLLLLTEYLFDNNNYQEKLNKMKYIKSNSIKDAKDIVKVDKKKNKYITYLWYSKMKENKKTDIFKYFFDKTFEEILLGESVKQK
jgi:hypothetical protein